MNEIESLIRHNNRSRLEPNQEEKDLTSELRELNQKKQTKPVRQRVTTVVRRLSELTAERVKVENELPYPDS